MLLFYNPDMINMFKIILDSIPYKNYIQIFEICQSSNEICKDYIVISIKLC